jgi:electron transfer flavoprotein beta subunit
MAVKKKVIPEWTLADLGIDAASVSAEKASIRILDASMPPPRAAGKILEGEPRDTAHELVRLLHEEAKVV